MEGASDRATAASGLAALDAFSGTFKKCGDHKLTRLLDDSILFSIVSFSKKASDFLLTLCSEAFS